MTSLSDIYNIGRMNFILSESSNIPPDSLTFYCKNIAKEIEAIAGCLLYRCPKCGEFIEWNNDQCSNGSCYTCPECNETFEESDLEAVSMYDYFDDALDIEYTVGTKKEFKSVCITVTLGGPNIYVDTKEMAVVLYWGGINARYELSRNAVDAIDGMAEEWYDVI